MREFGRTDEPQDAIPGFWEWWARARPEVDARADAGDLDGAAELVAVAAAAVHPELVVEVTPGRSARRSLVVSSAGDPELRPLAHRWALAAPPSDGTWEFHPSRQAVADPEGHVTKVNGREFGLDKLVLGLRVPQGTPRIDISAYHPIFPDLDDDTRTDATLLALDRLIGEDEVARWVGDITAATFQPIDAVAAVHLPAVVADVASEYAVEQWVLLTGETADGTRLIAAARHPLRSVDHPLFDLRVGITLPYANADEEGLPAGDSPEALRAFEERLVARLGDSAVLAVHMSSDGARVLHVYADPDGDAVAVAEELTAQWTEGAGSVDVALDPGWLVISPFLS
ncbi:DUF695 domain-containing protein [Sphaerisporangium sp. NPDC051011]|uniref:DUF695 domain-containing protein n=1 Tax=Sphaerisporangium sp. NPDC051011 TaxID=3155792 RepID=UPI0033F832BB